MKAMSAERTTIQVHTETRERLFEAKNSSDDTYDTVINRLLGETDE